jgi:uncharacterized protein YqeY
MSDNLEQRITDDLTAAMRAGDEDRKRTLRLLRAAIKNAEIDAVTRGVLARGESLRDDAVLPVLQKQAGQRRDAIDLYRKGDREELAAQEERELAIIAVYLPQPLSDTEVEALAREHIAAVGATGPADIGKVMGPLAKAVAGRADGKLVSATVRRLLAG